MPNPSADALLRRFFDRVAPGWSRDGPEEPLMAEEFVSLAWAWGPLFQDVLRDPVDPHFEDQANWALVELADGVPAPFSRLSRGARTILCMRCTVAIACARWRAREDEPDPIMFLPAGLSKDDRRTAATIRLLYDAPTAL